jgi:hypothetical protein
MSGPSKRRIVVDGVGYEYLIGRSNVRITSPDGTSRAASLDDVTGLSWDQIERGERKGYFSVTPSVIAAFIRGGEPPQAPRLTPHGTLSGGQARTGTEADSAADTREHALHGMSRA